MKWSELIQSDNWGGKLPINMIMHIELFPIKTYAPFCNLKYYEQSWFSIELMATPLI